MLINLPCVSHRKQIWISDLLTSLLNWCYSKTNTTNNFKYSVCILHTFSCPRIAPHLSRLGGFLFHSLFSFWYIETASFIVVAMLLLCKSMSKEGAVWLNFCLPADVPLQSPKTLHHVHTFLAGEIKQLFRTSTFSLQEDWYRMITLGAVRQGEYL